MTFDRIKKILVEQLNVKEELVTPGAHLIDDLGFDSLDAVELVMAIEEEFGIEVDDDKAQQIKLLSDMVSYVESIK